MSHAILEYSAITPLITIGTNMCCDVHGATLTTQGYGADIDLEAERQELPPTIESYLWLPTPDGQAPTQDQLWVGSAAIAQFVTLKKRVYVHCQHGHGRSPTLVIAYLIATGKSLDRAEPFVRSRRPEIHLTEVQLAALREFERRFRGKL